MLLDNPPARPAARVAPAERLRTTMAAMRLSFTWFGVRKTLTSQQKAQAAESFGAEGEFLSAGKKLLDTRDEKFKAVTSVRNRAIQYWKGISLPYPEAGIRLIKQSDLEAVNAQMGTCKSELEDAVTELDRHYASLKSAARRRLGALYNEADYPGSLAGLFDMNWDFPSVEPPPYLQQLSPELYRQECQRMQARFTEAVELAEQAFLEELFRLVDHLTERLTGQSDGKPKAFRDSAVTNLKDFFDRFRHLNIRSHEQLDELVQRAQHVLRGVAPQQLRDREDLRENVASQLSRVQSALDGLLVDRPRRNILRRPR
jgi:hypothetical protein